MAAEMSWRHIATGDTLYFTIRSAARTYWNTDTSGPTLESLTVLNWYNAATSDGNYWIALTETPASSYFYVGTIPATLAVGWYWMDVYKRAGATPAITDVLQGTVVGYWNGTSLLPWASDATEMKTQAITCDAPVTVGAYVGGTGATALASEVTSARMGALTDLIDGGRLDLLIDAIKAKTDSMTFTVAGKVDANMTHIVGNDATGGATVDANVVTVAANAITATSIAAGALTAAKFAAGAFDAVWTVAARTLTAISDSAGITTLLSRIVGTLSAGTHTAQSGDAYGVVNSGTHGNAALHTILTSTGVPLTSAERTSLAAAIEAAIINELDGTAVMQAIADLIASDMTTTDLTVAAIAAAARDAVLNRVLSGNHDTAGSVGKVLQDVDTRTAAVASSGVTLANAAHGGAAASFQFGAGGSITNANGTALTIQSTGNNGHGILINGNVNGHGISVTGGVGLTSWDIYCGGNGDRDIQNMITNYISPILLDTDELQQAITDGGRTDLLIDAIKAKTDLMLDAAAIRTAVGLASANLDTQFSNAATNLATLDTLVDKMAPLLVGTVTGAGTGTEVYAYGGVTATVTVDVDGNVSGVVFS